MLARREHSRAELARKLSGYSESSEEINKLLDELTARGFLSDERYVEGKVNSRKSRYGSRRIAKELLGKGVDEALVSQALVPLKEEEKQTAKLIWERKFGTFPKDPKEKSKQIRFLLGRGFDFEVITFVLREED